MLKSTVLAAAVLAVLLCVSNTSQGQVMVAPAPVAARDERFVSTFNGEIYNDDELRARLPDDARASLRGHCDAETIPWAFATWGPDCFARLQGMFAIALWSAPEQALYLARDPIGIKPLYFADYGGGLLACQRE